MQQPLLEVKNLKKYFPVTQGLLRKQVGEIKAVNGIDFTIHKGEVLALVGESGSGKSTVGKTAIRLIEPTSGEIFYEGKNLLLTESKDLKPFRKDFQIIFQDPYASLNPRKTIGESLIEPVLFHGMAKTKQDAYLHIEELLQGIGLPPESLSRYPHQFSGGQQQRICIGRAIALRPKLIVCDEAVSALDVSIQAQIVNLLLEIKETMGISYLFISHDLSVVRQLADRVVVLYLGKIMEVAPTEELFAHPKHPYTQALLSSIPPSHPNQKQKRNRIQLQGEIPSPRSPPSGCPFRTRCPYAQPQCAQTPPKKTNDGHEYHCIL